MTTTSPESSELRARLRDKIATFETLMLAELVGLDTLVDQLCLSQEADLNTKTQSLQAQITTMERRHKVELSLTHAAFNSVRHGPAQGVAPFDVQLAVLESSPLFDAQWYLENHTDLQGSPLGAEGHYAQLGAFEGRNPGPRFVSMDYYMANPDIAAGGWPALVHYEMFGCEDGREITWKMPQG